MEASVKEFAEKKILVTGAANGIGRAIASRFAGLGANIIAIDRDGIELEALARELWPQATITQIDCTDRTAVQRGIAEIEENHPSIDVLVDNVGQSPRGKRLAKLSITHIF